MELIRKIAHIDMDYFFAQVEELEDPSLKNKPFAVGGMGRRGIISTCNYVARRYGVRSAMPTFMAKEKCPDLILRKSQFEKYREASKKVFEVFYEFTDLVEKVSVDEAYLDLSHLENFRGSATLAVVEIKKRILEKTGLTASAGVSGNKLVAKICSEINKPNALNIVLPEDMQGFLAPLSLDKINGIGPSTLSKCHRNELFKIGDLITLQRYELQEIFGSFGETLYQYARGVDHRQIKTQRVAKSCSSEITFGEDLYESDVMLRKLAEVYEKTIVRLEKYKDRKIKSQFVKVKFTDFSSTTHEAPGEKLDFEMISALLKDRILNQSKGVRLIGCGVRFVDPNKSNEQLLLDV